MGIEQAIDITSSQRKTVLALIQQYLPGVAVWAYGSRVKWTSRPQSDLDLVAFASPEQKDRVGDLREAFEESDLPFRVDLFVWDEVPESFREQIEGERINLVDSSEKENDWDEYTIEQIADIVGGGTPSTKDPDNFGGNIPWLTPKDLSEPHARYITCGERSLSQKGLENSSAKLLPSGSVLLSTRAPVGYVAIAKNPISTNQGFRSLVPHEGFPSEYLYYWLIQNTEKLKQYTTGTTFGELSGSALGSIRIRLPSLIEQRAIADVLGTLDDKIELNCRMNETLEEMARALFKSWFVDFDPVRAKMENRDTGLPKHIANLFPDRLAESELGDVPEGWGIRNLADTFDLEMGQSPSGNTYNEHADGLPFFQGSSDFEFRFPQKRKFCTAPKRTAQPGDTLVSVRAPVGDINMAWEKCCIGRGVAALRHRSGSVSFTYYSAWAIQKQFRQYEHTGTVFGSINKQQFEALRVLEPTAEVINAFDSQVNTLDKRIRNGTSETHLLSFLRDTLLPGLVSGKIQTKGIGRPGTTI
ncbi:MAG: restriction endonuclease subunit S [Gammaproteobacteria bacterium]|nr:restriction endonuclease subunit S [Gammaproteobacteria bacterium]